MRSYKGRVALFEAHWARLTTDLPLLYFEKPVHFTADFLQAQIQKICEKNKHLDAARIRLTIFKGEGGIWEDPTTAFNWLLQSWPLQEIKPAFNHNGLDIGIFKEAHKSCDRLSNIKSNNYLLYSVAAQYARTQKWNDALVLNQFGRICDTTIANIFFIKNNRLFTPALSEGCVNGVMRSTLLRYFADQQIDVEEGAYEVEQLMQADEIFLTNTIRGIRWVKSLEDKKFAQLQSMHLYNRFFSS
ncbi:MAG: aminotransferase class IV [Bacteroidetes bacterium]|nr:aminotransferase class IV [Bacteroidota bacterium]